MVENMLSDHMNELVCQSGKTISFLSEFSILTHNHFIAIHINVDRHVPSQNQIKPF